MRQTLILTLVLTLLISTNADYFAGVLPDQKLAIDTTNAINDLKATLNQQFDCSENSRRNDNKIGGILNLGGLSLFGKPRKLFGLLQTFFKRNNDRSIITVNSPINKCSFESYFGFGKKNELYNKCIAVSRFLSKIKEIFKEYNNVILGSQNTVNGSKNFVAGSRDNINGNNNWVFTSDLTLGSVEDGVLIIGNFLIELVDIHLIPKNPNEAIRCIKTEDSNERYKKWWGSALRNRRIWL